MLLKLCTILAVICTTHALCVLDNKKGWWLDCGIRDSYLLRIKDFGGAYVRFDFDVGLGDEGGFPYSIDNTNKDHPPKKGIPPYIIPQKDKHAVYHRYAGTLPRQPSRYNPYRNQNRKLNVPEKRSKFRPKRLRPRRRKKKGPSRYMKIISSEVDPPPPEVFHAPDKKGIWIRVPSKVADDLDVDKVVEDVKKGIFPVRNDFESLGHGKQPPPRRIRPPIRKPPSHYSNPYHGQQVDRHYHVDSREHPNSHSHYSAERVDRPPFKDFRSPPPIEEPPTPAPYRGPVIGRALAEVLQMSPATPADTDHVPSFAAQLMVVKDAPESLHPPEYNNTGKDFSLITKLPRTKFFCEEQDYQPGLYADLQLGCKIFHLCLPAPLGSTMQSFLCPNSTVFDQSIMQCNYWQMVDCSTSSSHYDANKSLAHNYRKINAAHLPASLVKDPLTLSLLGDIHA